MRILLPVLLGFVGRALAITITNDTSAVAGKAYDFVIAGGGVGGLVVAKRLSEVSSWQILVIETGPDPRGVEEVFNPAMINTAFLDPRFDWAVLSTPQNVDKPNGGKQLSIIAGKCLGGGSCINGMMNVWGTEDQLNGLETLGNTGWNYQRFQNAILTAENFHVPNSAQAALNATYEASVHGTGGPFNTGYPDPFDAGTAMAPIIEASLNLVPGLEFNPDFNSGKTAGAGNFQYTITPSPFNNSRTTSAAAYIYPYENEAPNLTILTEHTVDKILFDTSATPKATGIQFVPAGATNASTVTVNKEVIVAGGTLRSPPILLRSGVGDFTTLKTLGISTVVNNSNVGLNFQDQLLAPLNFQAVPTYNLTPEATAPPFAAEVLIPFDLLLGANQSATVKANTNVADIVAAIVKAGGTTSPSGMEKIITLTLNNIYGGTPVIELLGEGQPFLIQSTLPVFAMVPSLEVPLSRGSIKLNTTNPNDPPLLDPAALSVDFDTELYIEGLRLSRELFKTEPLANLTTAELTPGTAVVPAEATDAQWQNFLYNGSIYLAAHPAGSLSMLPQEDGGVVDPNLIVYGTQNVRVSDMSIMPYVIGAHNSRTVYAIGEIAAGIIKDAYGQGGSGKKSAAVANFGVSGSVLVVLSSIVAFLLL